MLLLEYKPVHITKDGSCVMNRKPDLTEDEAQEAFQAALDASVVFSIHGKIERDNPDALDILKKFRDTVYDIFRPDDHDYFHAKWATVVLSEPGAADVSLEERIAAAREDIREALKNVGRIVAESGGDEIRACTFCAHLCARMNAFLNHRNSH
jgi:hypothetical protein